METKNLMLKEFIDLSYNNFKDNGYYEDLTNQELTSILLMQSKNLITELIYLNSKKQNVLNQEKFLKLFKNIGILAKINDINLEE